jgi:uncharacterized protein (TIGR00159 family)
MKPSDLFDIALISVFIYSMLLWFRRTASRRVVIGICLMAGIYFLARLFDLYLTQMLFRTIFAVMLVAVVVVFQEEIRRAFERMAIWGTFRERRRYVGFQAADTLIEAAAALASNRTGALIVIKGREPLDRHVEGGILLQGRISKPLLYSIFDPHSAGHDGALLIDADRIAKFGAHLPLSKNLVQVGMLGTRHTAALGISECSDAFVIVVSEETGEIRVARDGVLTPMNSVAELKGRLDRFYQEKFPRPAQPDWKRFLERDARLKALSLLLALLAWSMFANRSQQVQRTFAVPVEYRNLPAGWALEGVKTPEAMVTLTGSQREFNLLNPTGLVVSLDLSGVEEGTQRFYISEKELRHPGNLKVYRIDPNLITVEVHRVSVVTLPVQVQSVGRLSPGLKLVALKAVPDSVQARVRASEARGFGSVLTEPVDLSQITQTTLVKARLALPESLHLLAPELPEVQVTVAVEEQGKPGKP